MLCTGRWREAQPGPLEALTNQPLAAHPSTQQHSGSQPGSRAPVQGHLCLRLPPLKRRHQHEVARPPTAASTVGASSAAAAAGPPNTLQLIAAARQFLATSSAGQLRLADLPVLMADYRRLARLGWNMLLRCAPAACLLPLPAAAACCLIALPPSEAGHCEAASAW